MQFNQPTFSPTYPNHGQYFPFHPPQLQNVPYPEVIGEGEVISVYLPDGTVQFYFKPTSIAPNFSPWNVDPRNYPFRNNCGVWYIKNISYPLTFLQQFPNVESSLRKPERNSDHLYLTPHELKFHNDLATSTADLHHFYPRTPNNHWFSNPSEAVQVEFNPNEATYSKPYRNIPIHPKPRSRTSCTSMSVEDIPKEDKFTLSNQEPNTKKHRNTKRCSKCKTESRCKAECRYYDKAVTTFADRGSGRSAEKGRKTQTSTSCFKRHLSFCCLSSSESKIRTIRKSPKSLELCECCTSESDDLSSVCDK